MILLLPGCPTTEANPTDGGVDSGVVDAGDPDAGDPDAGDPDAGAADAGAPDGAAPDAGPVVMADTVDLLFMVDTSGSMAEEQASLGAELPRLVTILSTGDRTGDGPTSDDFRPVTSLHVGVVTSNMGVAGYAIPTCGAAPMFGDDGLLRTVGNTAVAGCSAVYPTFLEYVPGVSPQTPEAFGADFRCVATAGTYGCGFEQQLESTLKALTPSSSALTFLAGTHGHGDAENAGFLRPDSLLAVLLITDEDDCSVAAGSEGIFDTSGSSGFTGDLNLRCFEYPGARWPVARYVDGFKALRAGRPELLVVGAITGVPADLVGAGTPDYSALLSDPRMVEAVDPSVPGAGRLVPSCNVPGRGVAFPPRRIVQVAEGFGDNGIVQSICQESFTGALDAVIAKVAGTLGGV